MYGGDSINAEQVLCAAINNSTISKDRAIGQRLMEIAISLADEIQRNEKINPQPQDSPCCAEFEKWAKEMSEANMGANAKVCAFCGKTISPERKAKYLKHASF